MSFHTFLGGTRARSNRWCRGWRRHPPGTPLGKNQPVLGSWWVQVREAAGDVVLVSASPPLFPPIALLLQEMFICRKEEPHLGRWDGDVGRRVTSLEDQKHEDLGSSDADFGFTSAGHPASLLALPCLSFPHK